jgi:hypothetical protein
VKAIGGFIDLDSLHRAGRKQPLDQPDRVLDFAYGRNAVFYILNTLKPKALHLPFYLCDTVAIPAQMLNIPIHWYAIQHDFSPQLPEVADNEMILIVNYFGLLSDRILAYAKVFGERMITDNTQAWYDSPATECWTFNSTRKYFGVPDGAQLFGPTHFNYEFQDAKNIPEYRHLLERVLGRADIAYQYFVSAEDSIQCSTLMMSELSTALMQSVPHAEYIDIRRENYSRLHELLAPLNQLSDVVGFMPKAPFMYPFLPIHKMRHEELYARNIFAPILWKDCIRREVHGFEFEKQLAENLIPLPLDYRYSTADMQDLVHRLQGLL